MGHKAQIYLLGWPSLCRQNGSEVAGGARPLLQLWHALPGGLSLACSPVSKCGVMLFLSAHYILGIWCAFDLPEQQLQCTSQRVVEGVICILRLLSLHQHSRLNLSSKPLQPCQSIEYEHRKGSAQSKGPS